MNFAFSRKLHPNFEKVALHLKHCLYFKLSWKKHLLERRCLGSASSKTVSTNWEHVYMRPKTGSRSQTALKNCSVYMVLSLRSTLRSQTSFKNVFVYIWICDLRFEFRNFLNRDKILMHMRKWQLLINTSLINTRQMLC